MNNNLYRPAGALRGKKKAKRLPCENTLSTASQFETLAQVLHRIPDEPGESVEPPAANICDPLRLPAAHKYSS